jgi:hypothetical protein
MGQCETLFARLQKRIPWNKGKLIGAKPPLRPKHVWSIRTKLEASGRSRDLAMFNVAVDSKLRGSDVVALKVADIAPNGYAIDRAIIRQRKTGQPVKFELTEQADKRWTNMSRRQVRSPPTFYSQAAATRSGALQLDNMHDWSLSGPQTLDWIRTDLVHTRCAGPKRL